MGRADTLVMIGLLVKNERDQVPCSNKMNVENVKAEMGCKLRSLEGMTSEVIFQYIGYV